MHDVIREFRRLLDSYDERVAIGETHLPLDELTKYYGQKGDELHMPFNFTLIYLPWRARAFRWAVNAYEAALRRQQELVPTAVFWPNHALGNHDEHRIASRLGKAQARVAAMLLLTLRGTPTLYCGDEIGMTDVEIPPEREQDLGASRCPGSGWAVTQSAIPYF